MARKIKNRRRIKSKDKRNNLVLVLVLLIVVVSVFSTLIVIKNVDDAKKLLISQNIPKPTGKIELTILPNYDNYVPDNTPQGAMIPGHVGVSIEQ